MEYVTILTCMVKGELKTVRLTQEEQEQYDFKDQLATLWGRLEEVLNCEFEDIDWDDNFIKLIEDHYNSYYVATEAKTGIKYYMTINKLRIK